MPDNARVVVVGTTPDYIDWIRKKYPGRGLFLTDPELRQRAEEPFPGKEEEMLCPIDSGRIDTIVSALDDHLSQWGQHPTGVACFDCESMETAAMIAARYSLDYPGVGAIGNSRDKQACKRIWQANGVACPRSMRVNTLEQVVGFMAGMEAGIVLKPSWGSGSELVFSCTTKADCERAFDAMVQGLAERATRPLFKTNGGQACGILAEELVHGIEFSCDFIVENRAVTIVRTARKIKMAGKPFGTILGYEIPAPVLTGMAHGRLERLLFKGAAALGIERGICMVDFIMHDDGPMLIEMTPRPGGDCLPFLLVESGNLDILGLTLDFAEKRPFILNGPHGFKPFMAVRIFAPRGGTLTGIDLNRLNDRADIRKIHLTRKPGHVITMPPQDYDSWLLGHVIVALPHGLAGHSFDDFCLGISRLINVEIQ
ncbi:ArgH1 [Desulforapulum autotrophicum HRM2]|uniref:ArgH1 n=1 Tax=Desulforapulum autotrophicum (strain ATCC 43914 / DSM 3382 / VKM B-1955 / HRM2) TaxID=177437 RepID=C0QL77_DESAH|nr:ATP-grasp domain-containing protein [Desulforapulum autotrophicum]ACN14163.1 ArgH1 [Desulforapulum autotrophicum HRM2]